MARPASREERRGSGRAAAARVPPTVHADWQPSPDRPDPVALLADQARDRAPDLVPLRYGRMASSPFAFFRGAALPMAADLATVPTSGLQVSVCGDAHLMNFGLFASPERDLLFDINDFDETITGAWEWDLLRLSASLVIAARSRGLDEHHGRHVVHAAIRTYVARMAEYAGMRAIDVYYAKVDASAVLEFVDKRARPYLRRMVHAADHHDALHELPRITVHVDGALRIVDRPPTIAHLAQMDLAVIEEAMGRYRESLQEDRRALIDRYRIVDGALKVVGVGSVGLGAFVLLLDGGDEDDPLFLQAKEAGASVFERFGFASGYAHHGERVVAGQRRLQAASDVLLGWTTGSRGRHLYVRQLNDMKVAAVVEAMTAEDLLTWGELCGWALARGHARSGDPAAISGYLGEDDLMAHAMARFAVRYADQNERDHAALVTAIAAGRVEAQADA